MIGGKYFVRNGCFFYLNKFIAIIDEGKVQWNRDAEIDNLFGKLKIDEGEKNMLKFKNKIESISSTPKSQKKMYYLR